MIFVDKYYFSVVFVVDGFQDAFHKISRYEGVGSLWSGLSPTLVLAVPATMCYFVAYESARLYMKDLYRKFSSSMVKKQIFLLSNL